MIDNILYPDSYGLILDIDVSNSGSCQHVLYKDDSGYVQDISVVNNGSCQNILYPKQEMLRFILDATKTYSRSRVVNK